MLNVVNGYGESYAASIKTCPFHEKCRIIIGRMTLKRIYDRECALIFVDHCVPRVGSLGNRYARFIRQRLLRDSRTFWPTQKGGRQDSLYAAAGRSWPSDDRAA